MLRLAVVVGRPQIARKLEVVAAVFRIGTAISTDGQGPVEVLAYDLIPRREVVESETDIGVDLLADRLGAVSRDGMDHEVFHYTLLSETESGRLARLPT